MITNETTGKKEIFKNADLLRRKSNGSLCLQKEGSAPSWTGISEIYAEMMIAEFFSRFNIDSSGYLHELYFPADGEA